MTELTVKEFAAHERVTERTVWTWIAKGAIPVRRTPGGRVRIPVDRRTVLVLGLKNTEVPRSPSR